MEKRKYDIIDLDKQWLELHGALVERCYDGTDNFEWSKISKLPLKVVNILQSMTWRMRDSEEASRILVDNDYIHPAAILIRSAMENTAFVYTLVEIVQSVIDEGKVLENTDKDLMNLSFGNNYHKGEYISNETFESMKEHKAFRTWELMERIDKCYPSYYSMYRSLCEFVHANTDGVQGCFSQLDEKTHVTYYGKILTKESKIFPAIESSIVLALSIYKKCFDIISNMLPRFIEICEEDIVRKRINT